MQGNWESAWRKKIVVAFVLAGSIALTLFTGETTRVLAQITTEIIMAPSINEFDTATVSVSYRWNVTVKVKNVSDLFAYQIGLHYDSGMINATNAWLPTWDAQWVFHERSTVGLTPTFHSGYVQVGDSILGYTQPTFHGTGKLAVIEFQIVRDPRKSEELSSALDINNEDTFLLDFDLNDISTLKADGSYRYAWSPPETRPYLAVSPAFVRQPLAGDEFEVKICVMELDLGWQLTNLTLSLCYNAAIIDVVGGPANMTIDPNWAGPNEANVTHGVQDRIILTVRNPTVASGNLTVANVTFTVMSHGKTNLTFCDHSLYDHTLEIPTLQARNGSVNTEEPISDVAIIDVKSLKTVVGQGAGADINITLANEGDFPETFTVTAYANTTIIQTKTISLANGNYATVSFFWNTTGYAKGIYTISAYAWPVAGETDLADNAFLDCCVNVAMIGDITGPTLGVPDGKINIRDIAKVSMAFGSHPGHPRWDADADITGARALVPDGEVDTRDIALVAKDFGKTDP